MAAIAAGTANPSEPARFAIGDDVGIGPVSPVSARVLDESLPSRNTEVPRFHLRSKNARKTSNVRPATPPTTPPAITPPEGVFPEALLTIPAMPAPDDDVAVADDDVPENVPVPVLLLLKLVVESDPVVVYV